MTEPSWNDCTDAQAMLEFLRGSGRTSDRKLILFGCACQRRILHLRQSDTARKAVETLEPYADGLTERVHLPDWLRDSESIAVAGGCSRDAARSSARLGLLTASDEQR